MSVPVFIDLESNDQIAELRAYLKSKGATLSEENTDRTLEENLEEVITASEVLWSKDGIKEDDLESVFNSIITLVMVMPFEKSDLLTQELCKQLCKSQTQDKRTITRLRLLSNLFNGLEETSPLRYTAYSTLIKLAGRVELLHLVNPKLEEIKTWAGQWNLATPKLQSLLRTLHEAFLDSKQPEKAAKTMVELLGTYTEENASQAREDAQKCIISSLADPNVLLLDHLLTLKPIKFLEGEPIHNLLTIFVTSKLSQYVTFYESHKDLINSFGLSHEQNMHKMRILTFMQIAEGKTELGFDLIEKELLLKPEEVEAFVIDVVRTKSVYAKIDQMSEKVLINTAINRTFGRQQWIHLRDQLNIWKQSLLVVQNSLQSVTPR